VDNSNDKPMVIAYHKDMKKCPYCKKAIVIPSWVTCESSKCLYKRKKDNKKK